MKDAIEMMTADALAIAIETSYENVKLKRRLAISIGLNVVVCITLIISLF